MKLIVCDLDGTLLNEKKEISEKNRDILRKAAANGIDIALASGRSQHSIRKFQKDLGVEVFAVCNNGANIYDKVGNLIFSNPMSGEVTKKVIDFLRNKKIDYNGFSDKLLFLDDKEKNPVITVEGGNFEISELKNLELYPEMFKIIAKGDNEIIQNLKIDILKEDFASYLDVTITQTRCVDIVDSNCSKGKGIKFLSEYFNIPLNEIIAFGDSENDISMLEVVGHPVVMENAMDSLKKKFPIRTLSNIEDGVAVHLMKTLNLK